jgi:hypothetical protein
MMNYLLSIFLLSISFATHTSGEKHSLENVQQSEAKRACLPVQTLTALLEERAERIESLGVALAALK